MQQRASGWTQTRTEPFETWRALYQGTPRFSFFHLDCKSVAGKVCSVSAVSSLMSETDITTKRIHSQSVTHLRGSVGENWQKEGCASPFVRGDVLCMRTKQSITQQPSNIHLKTIFIFFLSLTSISARLLWHLTQTSRNEIKGFAEIISPRRVA